MIDDMNLTLGRRVIIVDQQANKAYGLLMDYDATLGKWLVGITDDSCACHAIKDAAWVSPDRLAAVGWFSGHQMEQANAWALLPA